MGDSFYLTVMLCCNDEHGYFNEELVSVDVEDFLTVEPLEVNEDGSLSGVSFLLAEKNMVFGIDMKNLSDPHIVRLRYDPRRYSTHVGNIFWNAVALPVTDVCKLINWLRSQRWEMTQGLAEICEKWDSGDDVTPEDFKK